MRKWPLYLLGLIPATAAAWASFSTLAGLAAAAGWKSGDWLLPTSIDALGAMACWVWLTPAYTRAARVFARSTTFAVIVASVVGNGIGHLVSSEMLPAGVVLIVLVGAVPPSSLAAVIHLLVLVTSEPVPAAKRKAKVQDAAPVPAPKPVAETPPAPAKKAAAPKPAAAKSSPKSGTDQAPDELLVRKARHIDQEHREQHGKPISRDAARPLLGVSNEKTSEALRLARQEEVAS